MGTRLTLTDFTGGAEPWELGHATDEIMCGLSEIAVTKTDRSTASGGPVDGNVFIEALSYIDPPADRNEWRDRVAAIGSANCPNADQIARDWSAGKFDRLHRYDGDRKPPNYSGDEPVDEVLRTMGPKDGGIGPGSIWTAARDAGWPPRSFDPPRKATDIWTPDAIARLTENSSAIVSSSPSGNLLPSYLGSEIGRITPPRWLIDRTIPTPAVGMVFGKFASFKTTVGLDLEDAVLMGTAAFGHFQAEKKDVVSIHGEGLSGLKTRIEARARLHGVGLEQYSLLLVAKVPRVDRPEEWAALVATIEARGLNPGLILFDHLSIMLSGQDQNDATIATQAMQLAQALATHFNCTVLIIAHAGKDGEREVRGSSAFLDNVDFAFELTRTEGTDMVKVRCAKMRDGEAPEPFYLKAESRHGAAIMSFANKDDARKAAGKQVGLRRTDVSAALQAMGACPAGANEWTGAAGGIPTRQLAAEIARLRHEAEGDGLEVVAREIDVLVAVLNRGGRQGGPFDAYVVREQASGRQWAIAPGAVNPGVAP